MKTVLKQFYFPILLLGLSLGVVACGGENSTVDIVEGGTDEKPKVQALLLTQSFPYNASSKDSVAGDYVKQTKLVVPKDLGPQNKWVMFEGPVLENDLVAYRFYMDSRHRFDIYGKRVHDLVMDTVSWQYHDIMDWGSDILKVGNSLGMGSPGILYMDSVYTFSSHGEKTIEILQAQGDVASIRTTFNDLIIGDETITLVQDWSLRAGRREAEITLRIEDGVLPEGAAFVTGVVKHDTDLQILDTQDSKAVFSWGKQSYHGEKMGMAVLAKAEQVDRHQEDPLSHLLIFKEGLSDVAYAFMSAWERDVVPVKTQAAFEEAIKAAAKN